MNSLSQKLATLWIIEVTENPSGVVETRVATGKNAQEAISKVIDLIVKEGLMERHSEHEYQVSVAQLIPGSAAYFTMRYGRETDNRMFTKHGTNIGRFAHNYY